MELQGHLVNVYLTSEGAAKLSSEIVSLFKIPTGNAGRIQLPPILTKVGYLNTVTLFKLQLP